MGFLSGIVDTLFGTEGKAQKLNEEQMREALALITGVPLEQLFGQARGQITDQSRRDITKGFGSAISQVGASGVGQQLAAQRATAQSIGAGRQSLAQRGLYGSSLADNLSSGLRQQGRLTRAGIAANTAGQQGALLAGRGQALAADTRAREALLASLFTGQAGAQLGQAQAGANVLTGYQHVGTPGILGAGLGALGGAAFGGLGLGIGQWAQGLFK